MAEIKVEYFYNNEPYRLNGDRFEITQVLDGTKRFQKHYEQFADEINAEGGYLEIHLSDSKRYLNGVHFDVNVQGIPESLRQKIQKPTPFAR